MNAYSSFNDFRPYLPTADEFVREASRRLGHKVRTAYAEGRLWYVLLDILPETALETHPRFGTLTVGRVTRGFLLNNCPQGSMAVRKVKNRGFTGRGPRTVNVSAVSADALQVVLTYAYGKMCGGGLPCALGESP